jgi:phosphoribosylanthranilate isomerase
VIVQIYSVTHPDDVRALVEMGVDNIGVAPSGMGLPSELPHDEVRELFALMPAGVLGSALTVRTDLDEIMAMVDAVRPPILHVCPDTEALGVDEQRQLRARLPEGTLLMKAIEVGGPETATAAIDAAQRFAPISDFLILDTAVPHIPGIGAAGLVHDWDISARIVELVGAQTPVILAGGLSPDNVAESIRHVRPAGVDSFSLTNSAANRRRKDLDLVRGFVDEARSAAAELGL